MKWLILIAVIGFFFFKFPSLEEPKQVIQEVKEEIEKVSKEDNKPDGEIKYEKRWS
ncbi:MAG: hypothetical protein HZB76_05635 [Chlamydiae bacterium]|nr:hypothetical protein [Chlamydiota bacterium]